MVLENKDGLSHWLEILDEVRGDLVVNMCEVVSPAVLMVMPAVMSRAA